METTKIIHIYYDHGNEIAEVLAFMYKPILISLIKIINELYPAIQIVLKVNPNDLNNIQEGDTLLWVGSIKIPDFDLLKKKHIYTIHYNSEPYVKYVNSNEIWTYSRYMYASYRKIQNQIIKFVPILFEENVPSVPYNIRNEPMKLIFIGSLQFRENKYRTLPDTLKKNLIIIQNIWNDTDYNRFISDKANIFLNLNKEGTAALPSVRINKLLSHKCIIISEHTNTIDDELYKDLIYFCKIKEIGSILNEFMQKTPDELQDISDRRYKIFCERFNSKNLLNLIIEN